MSLFKMCSIHTYEILWNDGLANHYYCNKSYSKACKKFTEICSKKECKYIEFNTLVKESK